MKNFSISLLVLLCTILGGIKTQELEAQSQLPAQTDVTKNMEAILNTSLGFSVVTGFLPVDWYFDQSQQTGIFYELITQKGQKLDSINPETNLVLWFNGGPGSSSQIGSWAEMGPFEVNDSGNLQLRQYSWNSQAMLLFIDQPLNVGFSYTDTNYTVNNTETAALHLMNFLYNFYQLYPDLKKNPISFTGESFGGHYVPTFAAHFHRNDNFSSIQLKGVAVGDGWFNPQYQSLDYDTYYYSIGVASTYRQKQVVAHELDAYTAGQNEDYVSGTHISDSITDDNEVYGGIDVYNFADYDSLPTSFVVWLNKNKANYGIPDYIEYSMSNGPMYTAFAYDNFKNYQNEVEYLLNNGVNVTIYNGQNDIICNTVSQLKWIETLNWGNLNFWKLKKKQVWCTPSDGIVAGTFQTGVNFNFVVIYDAGHLVPTDQPARGFELFDRFLNNSWKNCSSSSSIS